MRSLIPPQSFVLLFLSFLSIVNASWPTKFGRKAHSNLNFTRRATGSTGPCRRDDLDQPTIDDIEIIFGRRVEVILNGISGVASISDWVSSLGADGKWPDSEVDYATQCEARRASWPAQEHWSRILTMAGAYHGGVRDNGDWAQNAALRDSIRLAMNWWFERDFLNVDCEDAGGTDACPCSDPPTPSTWMFNTNWFSNIILIPRYLGPVCLLLKPTLTESEYGHCTRITSRSFGNFDRVSPIYGANWLTGANALAVAAIGVDGAVLALDAKQLSSAYNKIHSEIAIVERTSADGIRPDGAFGQHEGLLYNGNYGKDYLNVVLSMDYAAAGTQFQADDTAKQAVETLLDGGRWMIIRNLVTKVLHWDLSVLPRFISFPVIDKQATSGLKTNITAIEVLGNLWGSSTLIDFAQSLSTTSSSSNAGDRVGNRMFYTNDYMVNRGNNYVSTLKMFSSRTKNTECVNSQNRLGFHLSDGTLYTYVSGNEYEDIAASWDWNMIPGTTTDYGATPLSCDDITFFGVESMVGGASNEAVGVSAMRYVNPKTRSLSFQKAWFFLDSDIQHVVVSGISSTGSSPVISVLDQKRRSGEIYMNNGTTSTHLWHANVGYVIQDPAGSFSVQQVVEEKTGDWSAIGTSNQPPTTVELFKAYVDHNSHDSPLEYTAYPGSELADFVEKSKTSPVISIQTDSSITAIYDEQHSTAMVVFWGAEGDQADYHVSGVQEGFTISADKAATLIFKQETGEITVADPTQSVDSISVTLSASCSGCNAKTLVFNLPTGGERGKSVTQMV